MVLLLSTLHQVLNCSVKVLRAVNTESVSLTFVTATGFREFYNFVGGAEAHVHYSISSRADLMIKGGMNADGTVPVVEIWRNFDKNMDPSVANLDSMVSKYG